MTFCFMVISLSPVMLWYALGRLYVFCASVALRAANLVPHGIPSVHCAHYTKNRASAASRFIHKLQSESMMYGA